MPGNRAADKDTDINVCGRDVKNEINGLKCSPAGDCFSS